MVSAAMHVLTETYLPRYVQQDLTVPLAEAVTAKRSEWRCNMDWAGRFVEEHMVRSSDHGTALRWDRVRDVMEEWWQENEATIRPAWRDVKKTLSDRLGDFKANLGARHDQQGGWRGWQWRDSAQQRYASMRPATGVAVFGNGSDNGRRLGC